MFIKYLVSLVGEDYNQYLNSDTATKKRIRLFAKLIHIPIILWFVLGCFLTQQLFYDVSVWAALCAGLVCSLFIYLIDLAILNFPKNLWATLFRVALGFVFAALGALLADVFIFEKDINEFLKDNKQTEIRELSNQKIYKQEMLVKESKGDFMKASKEALCEASGTCGSNQSKQESLQLLYKEKDGIRKNFSKKRGEVSFDHKKAIASCGLFCSRSPIDSDYKAALKNINNAEENEVNNINQRINTIESINSSGKSGTGAIFIAKKKYADKLKNKLDREESFLKELRINKNTSISNISSDIDQNSGLINRIKVLKNIVWEESISIIFSIMFFTVFLIFELVLILFKLLGRDTISDRLAAHHERVAITKIKIAEKELKDYEDARKSGYQGPLLSDGI